MRKKDQLRYELYGYADTERGKGSWRWAVFAGREKKPILVGAFYGTLQNAKMHAEETIARLKQDKHKPKSSRSPGKDSRAAAVG